MSRHPFRHDGFAAHAAPEAIEAKISELRGKRNTLDRDLAWLETLLVDRCRQVQRGEWPPKTGEAGDER